MIGLQTQEEVVWKPIDEPTIPPEPTMTPAPPVLPPTYTPPPVRLSLKWFYFCANFRYPLGALISTFTLFFSLASLDLNGLPFMSVAFILSGLLLTLAVWVCMSIAALWLRNFTPLAYRATMVLTTLFPVQYFCSASYQGSAVNVFSYIFFALCITLPELIYFGKRRQLFFPDSPVTKKHRINAAACLGASAVIFAVMTSIFYFAVEKPNSQKLWTIGEEVLYHRYSCYMVRAAQQANNLYITTNLYWWVDEAEARSGGYSPCSLCLPGSVGQGTDIGEDIAISPDADAHPELFYWVTESRNSYHEYDCRYITGAKGKVYYSSTIEELTRSGYYPCNICKPR